MADPLMAATTPTEALLRSSVVLRERLDAQIESLRSSVQRLRALTDEDKDLR